MRAVLRIDVLDDLLAPVARRQVDVDVGPLAPFLGQEPLEQQFHPHRIDGGDAEAVADRAVRGRTPALGEDATGLAKLHEIPHDEEVPGEAQLGDDREFLLDLRAGLVVIRPITIMSARFRDGAKERIVGFPRRQRIVGKTVTQIIEGETQTIGQGLGVAKGIAPVGEKGFHGLRPLEMTLGVFQEQAAGERERRVMTQAGEDVHQAASLRFRVQNAVGGDGIEAAGLGQIEQAQRAVVALPREVPLHLDERAVFAEKWNEPVDRRNIAGQGNQALQRLRFVEPGAERAPRRIHVRRRPGPRGQKTTEVSIAFPALNEQGDEGIAQLRNFGAHDGPHAGFLRGLKEPRRAGEAVPIDKSNRGVAHAGGMRHQILGARRPLQKRESRRRMEFGIHSPYCRLINLG